MSQTSHVHCKLAASPCGNIAPARHFTIVALVACSGALLTTGCTHREDSTVYRAPEPVVVVGSQWYAHAPVWVGIERGIFERHGFSVNWRFLNSSIDRLDKILVGEADFASVDEIAMLTAMSEVNEEFYWIGSHVNAAGLEGLVARDGIDEIAQLRGKTVGVTFGTSAEMTYRRLLRAEGLDPDSDVKLYNLREIDLHTAFRTGKVHATAIWEPVLTHLLKFKGAYALGMDTDTDIFKRFNRMTGPDVLVVRKSWVDADLDRARNFLSAYFEAVEWLVNHPDQAAAIAHRTYIQQDLSTIRKNLRSIEWYGARDQQRIMSGPSGLFEHTEFLVDLLYEESKITNKPDFRQWAHVDLVSNQAVPSRSARK